MTDEQPVRVPLKPPAGNAAPDRIVAALRAVASAVPIAGGVLAEIVNEIIPNQRIDRIESYLKNLAIEIDALKMDDVSDRMLRPSNIALIEQGAYQAARAISEERRKRIAACVARGISNSDKEAAGFERVLWLIGEMDDHELALLAAYFTGNSKSWARLGSQHATINAKQSDRDRALLHKAALIKLEKLGVFDFRYDYKPGTTDPVFEKSSGKPRGFYEISAIGRLVVKMAGLDT